MFYVVMVFEEEVSSDVERFSTLDRAQGFCSGVSAGAYEYGAGSAIAFVWGHDDEVQGELDPEQLEQAQVAVATAMAEK